MFQIPCSFLPFLPPSLLPSFFLSTGSYTIAQNNLELTMIHLPQLIDCWDNWLGPSHSDLGTTLSKAVMVVNSMVPQYHERGKPCIHIRSEKIIIHCGRHHESNTHRHDMEEATWEPGWGALPTEETDSAWWQRDKNKIGLRVWKVGARGIEQELVWDEGNWCLVVQM